MKTKKYETLSGRNYKSSQHPTSQPLDHMLSFILAHMMANYTVTARLNGPESAISLKNGGKYGHLPSEPS